MKNNMNKDLINEIEALNNTDQGIIGMVKMVQFNPEKYPNLSKYNFYQIREMLSGEKINV